MLRFNLILSGFCLPIVACGGNVGLDSNGANQENSATIGGSGELAGTGGTTTSSTTGPNLALHGGITLLTPTALSGIEDNACSGQTLNLSPVIDLIIDASSSMNAVVPSTAGRTKWQVVQDVVSSNVGFLPDTTAAGLLIYPNESTPPNLALSWVPIDTCVNTSAMVPAQTLGPAPSTQRDAIVSGMSNASPQGGTPTQDAYTYTLSDLLSPKWSNSAGTSYLALITDGEPTFSTGCIGAGDEQLPVDTSPLVQTISSAAVDHGVTTVVIGLPGSEQPSANGADGRIWLSAAARAGNSSLTSDCSDSGVPNYCHHDLSQVSDLQASLQEAIQSILGVVRPTAACTLTIPLPCCGRIVDTTKVSLFYTSNGQTPKKYLVEQSDPACSQGDGWYLTVDKQIGLCAKTCSTIQQDSTVRIDIRAGCFVPMD